METIPADEPVVRTGWRERVPRYDEVALLEAYIMSRAAGYGHDETTRALNDHCYAMLRSGTQLADYTSYVEGIAVLTAAFANTVYADWADRTQLLPIVEHVDSDLYITQEFPVVGTLDS